MPRDDPAGAREALEQAQETIDMYRRAAYELGQAVWRVDWDDIDVGRDARLRNAVDAVLDIDGFQVEEE